MRACVTFVGPIQESGKTAKKWSILVVQTGEPIQLDYDSEDDSLGARRALLADPNAFSVPTVKLLYGVHKALQLASGANSTPDDDDVAG